MYNWAQNKIKVHQAHAKLKAHAHVNNLPEPTEEEIKAEYVKRGGKVLEEAATPAVAVSYEPEVKKVVKTKKK